MKRYLVVLLACGVALTAILVLRCSKKTNPTAPTPAAQGSSKNISIVDNSFSPATLSVAAGDTVVWTNNGSIAHTSTSGSGCTGDGKWDSGSMSSGATYRHVFAAAGTYPYFCTYHCSMGMTGTVTVTAR